MREPTADPRAAPATPLTPPQLDLLGATASAATVVAALAWVSADPLATAPSGSTTTRLIVVP